MSRHVVLAAVLAGLAAATLTACTVGGPPLGSAAPAATTSPAVGSTQTATGAPAATGQAAGGGIPELPAGLPDLSGINNIGGVAVGGSLPAGFPTPPGAGQPRAIGAEGNIAAQIQVADPTSAYNFWLSALPAAGYSVGQQGITTINGVVHAGINFSGHGYQPTSAIAIVGTTATLGFEGGGSGGSGGVAVPPAAGGGALITVEQPNVSETLPCTGGNTVYIQGPSDNITLTGNCGVVNVTGAQDTVVADSATAFNLTGVGDTVTVHTGNPQVSKTGVNDTYHLG